MLMSEQNVAAALEVTDCASVLGMGERKFEADADTLQDSQRVHDRYLGRRCPSPASTAGGPSSNGTGKTESMC